MILLLVVFKKEVADSVPVSISMLIVNKRFSEDRLATARIRRDPEQVIVWFSMPLEILGVSQHPLTSTFHPLGIDILELFVRARFECSMTSAMLIIMVPLVLFLVFSLYLMKMLFR